ncbi:MAG: glucose 1-dehydrogenase [Chloroflexi bacterium]|nr:glucose 1-dehydrogenase [Chloroflexota bacterium]
MKSEINEQPVAGQMAIVTGAAQGIGRGIALRLGRDGYRVLVADLRLEAAQATADAIVAAGGAAWGIAADVTRAADRAHLMVSAIERGGLDLLVNNAGINRASAPLDVTEEHWDVVMSVNAKAVWFMCQEAMRHMVSRRSGRIVNIASIAGKMASTLNHPIYNVAKAAVIAMTKTLAHAGAAQRVRVNCVCPGVIETSMQDQLDGAFAELTGKPPEQIRAERLARIPMGALGGPEEVADVVAFLASPDARYMTGQAINVSGGMMMF